MGNQSSKMSKSKYPATENSAIIKESLKDKYEENTVLIKDVELTYAGEEFYTTSEGIRATLEKYGIAIIPNVLTEEECSKMNEGMWSTAEHVTSKMEVPVKRSDPSTYASLFELKPKDGAGLFHDFGWNHAQYVWDIRSNDKVFETYRNIFGTKDLLVSIDGVNCGLGPLIEDPKYKREEIGLFTGKHLLHCEQRYNMNDFELVQSWITANPVKVGDGTLRVIQGSHKLHKEFKDAFSESGIGMGISYNWHVLHEKQIQWLKDRGCRDICLTVPAGSHVLWDSRTVHCGHKALATEDLPSHMRDEPRIHRNVVYVTMVPRKYANKQCMKIRKLLFDKNEPNPYIFSGHRAHEMKTCPQVTQVDFGVPKMPMPILNSKATKLAGI